MMGRAALTHPTIYETKSGGAGLFRGPDRRYGEMAEGVDAALSARKGVPKAHGNKSGHDGESLGLELRGWGVAVGTW